LTAAGLRVVNIDGDPQPEIVAMTEKGLWAFDSQSFAQEWMLPINSGSAFEVATNDGVQELLVAQGSTVHVLRASDRVEVRHFSLPTGTSAMQALGGNEHTLLVAMQGGLYLYDAVSGTQLAQSAFLSSSPKGSSGLDIRSTSTPGIYDVLVGAEMGLIEVTVDARDELFASGFEP
jgi:hypothetical protein